jgi:hypothetical protein
MVAGAVDAGLVWVAEGVETDAVGRDAPHAAPPKARAVTAAIPNHQPGCRLITRPVMPPTVATQILLEVYDSGTTTNERVTR